MNFLKAHTALFLSITLGILILISVVFFYFSPLSSQPKEKIIIDTSQLEGQFSAQFDNQENFKNKLQDMGLFGEKGVGIHDGMNVSWQTIEQLQIIFVTEPQSWPLISKEKGTKQVSSFNIKMDEDQSALLYIYVDPSYSQDLGDFSLLINRSVFLAIYKIRYWPDGEDETMFSYINTINEELENLDINQRPIIINL